MPLRPWLDLIDTFTSMSRLRMSRGFGDRTRTAVALDAGSTSDPTYATRPTMGAGCAAVTIVASCPAATPARSDSNTLAITHTVDRSAMVKHGVLPAWMSWPGFTSFSTTVPSIGARITASSADVARFSRTAAMLCSSTPSARICSIAASRSAAAAAASVCACSSSRRGIASFLKSCSSRSAMRCRLRYADCALRYAADRRREVRRRDHGERLAAAHDRARIDEDLRDRSGDGSQHLRRPVAVERNGPRRLNRRAIRRASGRATRGCAPTARV